jgi:hypothetical protein
MIIEQLYIKYHEARLWVAQKYNRGEQSPYEQHLFARFYAESDWDDPQAAWIEFAAK